MLALARVLIHEPEILLIDELSLGLAPVVVQRMLELVDRAQGAGPDDDHRRAVAQRRARDRRPGDLPREGRGASSRAPPQELLERDDLARAVFFGTEGG